MKKLSKSVSVVVLCLIVMALSVVPAFAADYSTVEDHSVVDCTHYYKENGNYYFQIKCPKGELEKVSLSLTKDAYGNGGHGGISFKYTSFKQLYGKEHAYSDDNYDYTWFIVKCSEYPDAYESSWGGMGIKIYYYEDGNSKMATNTSNGSTTPGPGYWLSA